MRQKSSSSLLKEVKRRNKIKIGCLLLYLCIQKRFARLYFSKNAFSSLLAAFENKSRFTLIFSTTLLPTPLTNPFAFLVAEKVHTTLWRLLGPNTAYYIWIQVLLNFKCTWNCVMVKKVITKTFWQQITTFFISDNRQSFKIYSG